MKIITSVWVGLLAGGLSLAAVACGGDDDGTGLTCGAGTVEENGMCVADGGDVSCGPGTVLMGDECVPDGSVICDDGTVFEEESGTCVVSGDACADGTVFDDTTGLCIPFDDTLVGDNHEGEGANDPHFGGTPATFTPGEVGEIVTFDGCVTPTDLNGDDALDPDLDYWAFTVDAPAMYRIKIDGKGGISAGFVVESTDQALIDQGWQRFGLDLVSDGAERKIYLPKAGTYWLGAGDARTFLVGSPAGDAGGAGCYYMELEQVTIPAAVPMTTDIVTGTLGDPQFYFFNATERGELHYNGVTQQSFAASEALIQIKNGEFDRSASGFGAATVSAGLEVGDRVTLVVDYVYEYSLDPVPFELQSYNGNAVEASGPISVEHIADTYSHLWVEAEAGQVISVDWGGTETGDFFQIQVVNPDFTQIVGMPCFGCDTTTFYLQAQTTGLYYIRFYDLDGVAPLTYTLNVDTATLEPQTLEVGSSAVGALAAAENDFFVLDTSGNDWLQLGLKDLVDMTSGSFTFYSRSGDGVLGDAVPVLDDDAVVDGVPFGRIVSGENNVYLVSVNNFDGHLGTETFSVTLDARDFTDLGSADPKAPIARTGDTVAADDVHRYLVRGLLGSTITMTVTGTGGFDAVLDRLERDELSLETADSTQADGEETLSAVIDASGWAAFTVSGTLGAEGTYDVGITATAPPYDTTHGALPFSDICPAAGGAGTLHAVDNTDDGLSLAAIDLPFPFELFGEAVTEATVSTNGFLSLETAYSGDSALTNGPIPDPELPNALIAPLWDDYELIQVCVLSSSSELTVQWAGVQWGTSVAAQFQAVLHSDGSIDFIYGPSTATDGEFATIGVENIAGEVGLQVGFDTAGSAGPGESYTFTPNL